MIYLLVYVDDIIITGNNDTVVQQFITLLSNRFSIQDLGPLTYFLGVEVIPHPHGIFLSQRRYIQDLFSRSHMIGAKLVSTPLATSPTLTLHSGFSTSNPVAYRAFVGSL